MVIEEKAVVQLTTDEIYKRFISIAQLAQLVKVKNLIETEAFRRLEIRVKKSRERRFGPREDVPPVDGNVKVEGERI